MVWISLATSVIYASLPAFINALPAQAAPQTVKDPRGKTLVTRDPPGDTLEEGFLWIRTVQEPYFHYYLQTDPQLEPGPGIFGEPATAGQFNVENGQLVELADTDGTLLYLHVEEPAGETVMMLGVTFEAEENGFGEFVLSGDSVTWTEPGIERPNEAAWLICGGDQAFINLGSFGGDTPEGCTDVTIHTYGGATADP